MTSKWVTIKKYTDALPFRNQVVAFQTNIYHYGVTRRPYPYKPKLRVWTATPDLNLEDCVFIGFFSYAEYKGMLATKGMDISNNAHEFVALGLPGEDQIRDRFYEDDLAFEASNGHNYDDGQAGYIRMRLATEGEIAAARAAVLEGLAVPKGVRTSSGFLKRLGITA